MGPDEKDALCRGVAALLRRVHPRGAARELDGAPAEFAAALEVVGDRESHDLEDRSHGSLTAPTRRGSGRASSSPPGMFADPRCGGRSARGPAS